MNNECNVLCRHPTYPTKCIQKSHNVDLLEFLVCSSVHLNTDVSIYRYVCVFVCVCVFLGRKIVVE